MSNVSVKAVHEIPAYEGPHQIPGIRFRHARAELGVTAWGMNVIEIDPENDGYPSHDHTKDGQEEVYVILSGSAVLRMADREVPLEQGQLVRVPPEVERKFVTRDSAVTILALGATPGKAYEPASF